MKGKWAEGFAAYVASRAAAQIPGVAFRSYTLLAVPRTGMPDLPRGYTVTELEAAALVDHAAVLELPLAAIEHRTGQGMTCLAAMRNGELIGVNFVTTTGFDEDEVAVRFVPPAGAAWDTGLYVRAEYRGTRAFAALWAGTASWMAARGLDWSLSRIARNNLPSIAAHARMGGVVVGELNALRFRRHQWLFGASPVIYPRLP